MGSKTKISVIMPVYNAEPYLEAAVRSVLLQTFDDLELIGVDDCSSDGSFALLERLAAADARLKPIRLPRNVGAGEARNAGLDAASGDYVTFIDADDAIEPDLYEKAFALTENGAADEVVWGLKEEHYNARGKWIKTVPIIPRAGFFRGGEIPDIVLELERDTLFGYQWNSLYRADLIRQNEIRFSDALFYEDYFFNLAFIRKAETLAVLDHAGYHYFKRKNGSVTSRFTPDYFALSYRRVETMLEYCRAFGASAENATAILGNKLLRYTLSALARNCSLLSGMDRAARRKWLIETAELPLYAELLPACGGQNPVFSLLRHCLLHRNYSGALWLGRVVFQVRGGGR